MNLNIFLSTRDYAKPFQFSFATKTTIPHGLLAVLAEYTKVHAIAGKHSFYPNTTGISVTFFLREATHFWPHFITSPRIRHFNISLVLEFPASPFFRHRCAVAISTFIFCFSVFASLRCESHIFLCCGWRSWRRGTVLCCMRYCSIV